MTNENVEKRPMTFNFIISAYHMADNVEVSVEDSFAHIGRIGGYEEAECKAYKVAYEKWPMPEYYGHYVS